MGGSFQFFQSLLEFCSLTKEGFTNKFKYCSSQRPLCPARGGGGQGEVGTPRPSAPHSPALLVGGNPQGGCCTQFSGLWDSTVPSNSQLTLPDPAKASGVSQGLLCPTPVQFRKPVPAWRCWFSPSAASPDSRWEDWGAPHCPVAWGWTGCWGGLASPPTPPGCQWEQGVWWGPWQGGSPCTDQYGPVQPCTARYGAVQTCMDMYSPVQPCTAQYGALQSCIAQYSPVWPNTALYRPVWPHMGLYSPIELSTAQCSPPHPSQALRIPVQPTMSQLSPPYPSTAQCSPAQTTTSQSSPPYPSIA